MSVQAAGQKRQGRSARRNLRQTHDVKMLPALERKLPLTEPMTQAQIERIDSASMDILENVGVHFRDPIALRDWKGAGAKVVDETVFQYRQHVRELLATITAHIT